jgi:glycosyltransferase involved in cell wall biosynthesis
VAPLYNAARDLDVFLERVGETVGSEAQLILIDDASTDGTRGRIAEWARGRDNVITLGNESNLGVARARNRALACADREFVWFVDHDDDWDVDILDVFASATADDIDVVVCRAEYRHEPARPGRIIDGVDGRRAVAPAEFFGLMLSGEINGFLWSKVIRRTCLGADPFPPLSSQSDFVGLVRAAENGSRFQLIPDVLYRYLRRESSITRRKNPELANLESAHDEMLAALRRHPGLGAGGELTGYFTAWFYCAAVAFTPIRQGASRAVRAEGVGRAKKRLRGISLLSLVRRRPTLGLSMALVRYASPVYSSAIGALLFVKACARRARSLSPLGRAR